MVSVVYAFRGDGTRIITARQARQNQLRKYNKNHVYGRPPQCKQFLDTPGKVIRLCRVFGLSMRHLNTPRASMEIRGPGPNR